MAEKDVSTWLRKKITTEVAIAFVLGLGIGLVVLGWWLWPVKWTSADLADLRPVHKETYLEMVAESYELTGNTEVARSRLEALKGPGQDEADLSSMLNELIQARLKAGKPMEAMRLQGLLSAMALPPAPTPVPTAAQPATTGGRPLLRIFGILFFLLLLGAGVLLLLSQLQKREPLRRRRPSPYTGEALARVPEVEREVSAVPPPPAEGSFGHFETTYNLGDEEYDVSYSIESVTGDFLGECGVSAVEKVGSGEPMRFTAFEVWLFDKIDSRMVTKVLLSEQAFADQALRERLADKGELIRAERGRVVTLETANLRLDALIAELEYESGSHNGVFAKLTTKLEISAKGTM
ncbi:MAG: hypothetical protein H5T68_08005 [Chloroflexi bacterium]|nr:hypothetical protein [Chloroflexota bacterium]